MTSIRTEPCTACPYRRDVPSGLWDESEYEKLRRYDAPMAEQPQAAFACHATADHYCAGWGAVGGFDLLALRIRSSVRHAAKWDGVIPTPTTPLFDSHTEACEHGLRDIEAPSEDARAAVDRLVAKHPRLTR